jgi:hypothetical protein
MFGGVACIIELMSHRKRSCVVCGEEIDEGIVHSQKYCSNLKCRLEYFARIRRQARDFRENLKGIREALNEQVREFRGDAAGAAGISNPEDFTPTAVPVNKRQVGRLPKERRSVFCEQLLRIIGEAAAERGSSTGSANDVTMKMKYDAGMQGSELRSILGYACAVCGGSCCFNGGEHAYLRVETMLLYMHQHPELQEEQVLDEYVSRLPDKTYEGSCVYHAESGCGLPREMRSESCDSFVCKGLSEIEEHAIETKSICFFIAAIDGGNILRSAFVQGNEIRGHRTYF